MLPRNKRRSRYTYRSAKQGIEAPVVCLIVSLILLIIVISMVMITNVADGSGEDSDEVTDVTTYEVTREPVESDVDTEAQVPQIPSGYKTLSVSNTKIGKGSLVLVNVSHSYDDKNVDTSSLMSLYNNGKKYSIATSDLTLLPDAYNALNQMTDDYYNETGKRNLLITQAYRTKEQQQKYYDDNISSVEDKKYYERAGYSDHQTGLGFNVKIFEDGVTMSYAKYAEQNASWIKDNLYKYGFTMRYRAENYEITGIYDEGDHFRYVGVPHSYYLVQNNDMSLEEYVSQLKQYTLSSGVLEIKCTEEEYIVYYTKASEGEFTDVYVPSESEYEISGNNVDGFIVWYKK